MNDLSQILDFWLLETATSLLAAGGLPEHMLLRDDEIIPKQNTGKRWGNYDTPEWIIDEVVTTGNHFLMTHRDEIWIREALTSIEKTKKKLYPTLAFNNGTKNSPVINPQSLWIHRERVYKKLKRSQMMKKKDRRRHRRLFSDAIANRCHLWSQERQCH